MTSSSTVAPRKRTNLLQRKLSYYARYYVPKHQQPSFGKPEVQRSLKTRDKLEAHRRLPGVLAELQREVDDAVRERQPVDWASPTEVVRIMESIGAAASRGEYAEPDEPGAVSVVDLHVDFALEEHARKLGQIDPETGSLLRLDPRVTEAATAALQAARDPKYRPISEWVTEHLASMEADGLVRSTRLKRERFLRELVDWTGSRRDPRRITADDAVRYGDLLRSTEASVRTKKDAATNLHTFFEWLRKNRRLITLNPFQGLSEQIEGSRNEGSRTIRAWDAEELRTCLDGLHPSSRLWTIAVIAMYSGMRINEVCSLTVCDVDRKAMSVTRENAKNANSVRSVPIHPVIAGLVERLVGTSSDGFLISGLKPAGQDGKRGAYPSKRFSTLRRDIGLASADTTFHSFRHTFISAAHRALVPEPIVQKLVGHARQGITLSRYDHPEWRTLVNELAKVSHDRPAFDDLPAVEIDQLVIGMVANHQGNAEWGSSRHVPDLARGRKGSNTPEAGVKK